jgi:hypothetical protein
MNDALSAARDYIERGWAPIPVPFRTKGPLLDEWQTLRINAETAPNFFNGASQNIGVILGAASGGLCDFDLDCAEAIAAAPSCLGLSSSGTRASAPPIGSIRRTSVTRRIARR